MITLTRQQCIELLSVKLDDFNSKEDWLNFDVEQFLRERGACNPDIRLIAEHYKDHIILVKQWYEQNELPDELFKI